MNTLAIEAPTAPAHEPRLLLVDDDPSAIQALSRMLAEYPQHRFATSGADALRLAREAPPDLILLDVDMPGMSGLQVCDALKADATLAHVPVIFVTSHDTPHLKAAALERGAVDFITKPLVAAQVTTRVRDRLRLQCLIDQAERGAATLRTRDTASRVTAQMLSYIAHEIGNPLNGIIGFAQVMAADKAHPLPAKQAERLQLVLASGERLRALMRDVADLGSYEAGGLTVNPLRTDVVPCMHAAAAGVECIAAQAQVTLSCDLQPQVLFAVVDAGRLQQCLANLLTNAIKYNRPGGWVRIELHEQATQLKIAVRDNGLGMDALQREHLFEPFNRLGRQLSTTPGVGLGLTITRTLVQAMGGQLTVESEPGEGSCFTVLLPRLGNADFSQHPVDLAARDGHRSPNHR